MIQTEYNKQSHKHIIVTIAGTYKVKSVFQAGEGISLTLAVSHCLALHSTDTHTAGVLFPEY